MSDVVLFEELAAANGKKIGKATLNVEKTLNSLTLDMVDLLSAKLNVWEADDAIVSVFITGSGEKAFCAGGDVQALHASAVATPGGPCVEGETFFEREYQLDYQIHVYPKPVLVWGDGIVMGGGLGIFAGGSHRVVTQTSRFAMPEVTIGLFPDVGGSFFLNTMPGKAGRFLALTGASFNSTDALYTGVATHFVDRELEDELLQAIVDTAPASEKAMSEVLAKFTAKSTELMPTGNVESHMEIINELCTADNIDDVFAAITGLDTEDKWLSRAQKALAHGSPLSVLIIDRQLKKCEGLALNDVFRSELSLATRIIRYPEFAEGVRALLIDKDQNPKWQFDSIDAVPADVLDSFFISPFEVHPLSAL